MDGGEFDGILRTRETQGRVRERKRELRIGDTREEVVTREIIESVRFKRLTKSFCSFLSLHENVYV